MLKVYSFKKVCNFAFSLLNNLFLENSVYSLPCPWSLLFLCSNVTFSERPSLTTQCLTLPIAILLLLPIYTTTLDPVMYLCILYNCYYKINCLWASLFSGIFLLPKQCLQYYLRNEYEWMNRSLWGEQLGWGQTAARSRSSSVSHPSTFPLVALDSQPC